MSDKLTIHPTQPTPEELIHIWDEAFHNFRGNSEKLKNAFGMLMLARTLGWKPAYLMHSRNTIKEYEKILNISIKDKFPPTTNLANRSIAWSVAGKLSNFWKAVKGEYPDIKTNSTELG
jgi:hypothetical protein